MAPWTFSSRHLLWVLGVTGLLTGFLCPDPARASADASAVCDRAAMAAAQETGVPVSVLRAISLTETGRKQGRALRPWPWTVNMEGKGVWFNDMTEALAYIETERARGATSFDVGCFQINHRWHGEAFSSVQQMFDPTANAIYAARFLSTLHTELGDWSAAAGAFHSRTPLYANRYRARFDRIRADLTDDPAIPQASDVADVPAIPAIPDIVLAENRQQSRTDVARVNLYPLLRANGVGVRGSLFPGSAGAGARPLIAAAPGAIIAQP